MPYIPLSERSSLELTRHAKTPGELNFLLTIDILDYLDRHKLSYATINDIIGAMECAKAEFIRRIVYEYEDKKIDSNTDLHQYAYWTENMP